MKLASASVSRPPTMSLDRFRQIPCVFGHLAVYLESRACSRESTLLMTLEAGAEGYMGPVRRGFSAHSSSGGGVARGESE